MVEEEKKSGLAEKLTKAYLDFKNNPGAVKEIKQFDELRQIQYGMQHERLNKEKDPADWAYQASKLFNQLKQEIAFFVGKDKYPGRFDDMKPEEQMQHYVSVGQTTMSDIINPNANK